MVFTMVNHTVTHAGRGKKMKVINTENRPIKMWTDLDGPAMAQARNLANLPFTFSHVAIMPDAHMGYGMPIGGVLATEGVVVPNAVGVDIGCGMCAVKTNIGHATEAQLKETVAEIRRRVPTGFKKHKFPQHPDLMPEPSPFMFVATKEYDNAAKSLGTLGGGNHFIEIQNDGETLWVMIHSGSRNLGKQVADHYNKVAKKMNERWYSEVPSKWDLAFLPTTSMEYVSYIDEMNYCVNFAMANRKAMMGEVLHCLSEVFGLVYREEPIDIAHNYATVENHFGKNVIVHRKGATRAREGEIGIIPGSQGTSSYIVQGLGNPQSFNSCSHGAGRRMGRKEAQRSLSLEGEQDKLKGIVHSVRGSKDLDEAPGAYKDIDTVMANQEDLVEITTKLTPLAVVKG
jgi:tRNA-splicing ligase RtcB